MANYKETFPSSHTVLPVIHVNTEVQSMSNAELAKREGADGIFLISMEGDTKKLLEIQRRVCDEFSTWFVGINLLGIPIVQAFKYLDKEVSGIWTDNAHIVEFQESQIYAEKINEARAKSNWDGLYFGGVAFKYQRPVEDVVLAAEIAKDYMDVVTTSGEGTGFAPNIDKIKKMKGAVGEHPLAIASGISVDNIEQFKPFADCFIVASSLLIPKSENFDPSKMRDFIQAAKS